MVTCLEVKKRLSRPALAIYRDPQKTDTKQKTITRFKN
jgi:hypothetical protein